MSFAIKEQFFIKRNVQPSLYSVVSIFGQRFGFALIEQFSTNETNAFDISFNLNAKFKYLINIFLSFQREYNFSHRIDKFSFGNPHGGIVQPLEGDEKIAEKSKNRIFISFEVWLKVKFLVQNLSATLSTKIPVF
jgi:hypothetical protein